MAHLHNYRHRQQPSMISQIGQKVLHAAQFAAEAKGLWDLGRGIYQTAQTIGPYIGAAAPALAALI
jgi:hypothetical protein